MLMSFSARGPRQWSWSACGKVVGRCTAGNALQLACSPGLSAAGLEYGGQLLAPLDEDILLSWAALVMMTASAVGVPLYPEVGGQLTGRATQGRFGTGLWL